MGTLNKHAFFVHHDVIPAEAGIQKANWDGLDPRIRGDDEVEEPIFMRECLPYRLLVASMTLAAVACARPTVPVGAVGHHVPSHFDGEALDLSAFVIKDSDPQTYTVAAGDTMWRISSRFDVSLSDLKEANPNIDPQALSIGAVLTIPKSATAVAAAASSASHVSSSRYPLRWPVAGTLTSRYGNRWGRTHDGIDIGAPRGTTVRAAADGEVVFSDTKGGYGNLVVLRHDKRLMTVYAHHDVNLVRKGQSVRAGDVIARVGNTGRSTNPHLHFEVRNGTQAVNPLKFLPP